MEIEYNNIICNATASPSRRFLRVAIPMYMYRIETCAFSSGLDFFEKTVLRFKAKPGMATQRIAEMTGLDEKLIEIVASALQRKGLLTQYGVLSEDGKDKLSEIEGLVINPNERRIGYLFQYIDAEGYYPYYVENIVRPDVTSDTKPRIIRGEKGDGDERDDSVFYLDEIFFRQKPKSALSEKQIAEIIKDTYSKRFDSMSEDIVETTIPKLNIRYIPTNRPEKVWVCTYIYLEGEDGIYNPDWKVLDPFGYGDNVQLKFYLNTKENKTLLSEIEKRFEDAQTSRKKRLEEYNQDLKNRIDEVVRDSFSTDFYNLDKNLQGYCEQIIEKHLHIQDNPQKWGNSAKEMILYICSAFENVFKHDRDNRQSVYEELVNRYPDDNTDSTNEKKRAIKNIYKSKLFSRDTFVPERLLKAMQGKVKNPQGLIQHLAAFALTYELDKNSPLFSMLNGKIELLIEIAHWRNNTCAHGTIGGRQTHGPDENLTKEKAKSYYDFIIEFINEYITKQ